MHIECDGISERGYDWVQTKDRLEYVCPGCAGRQAGEFGAQLERRLPPPPKPQLCRAPGDDEWLPPPSVNGVAPQLFDALHALGERPGAVGEQGGGGGGEAKGGGGSGGGGGGGGGGASNPPMLIHGGNSGNKAGRQGRFNSGNKGNRNNFNRRRNN